MPLNWAMGTRFTAPFIPHCSDGISRTDVFASTTRTWPLCIAHFKLATGSISTNLFASCGNPCIWSEQNRSPKLPGSPNSRTRSSRNSTGRFLPYHRHPIKTNSPQNSWQYFENMPHSPLVVQSRTPHPELPLCEQN